MKTALLVIDFINGIVRDGSCKKYAEDHPIIANANKLIAASRASNISVYFVRLAFDDAYSDCPLHSKMFSYVKANNKFKLGSSDTAFSEGLDIASIDTIVNKTAASPFHSKFKGQKFMDHLQAIGVERIIFSGVATDNAINIGAREANDAGFYTVIASDACGAGSEEHHRWSLEMLSKIANDIMPSDEVIAKYVAPTV